MQQREGNPIQSDVANQVLGLHTRGYPCREEDASNVAPFFVDQD